MGRYAFSSWSFAHGEHHLFSTLWGFALARVGGSSLKARRLDLWV